MTREEKIKELQAIAKEYFEKAKYLQRQLDELKAEPKLEAGKWYKNKTIKDSLLVYNNDENTYGFWMGDWDNDWSFYKKDAEYFEEATNEEVEKALIEEAKRRGFKEGVRYKSVAYETTTIIRKENWCCFNDCNGVLCFSWDNQKNSIFEKGKWAEIISEPKVIVNGYEMEQDGDTIKFGCARFHKDQISDWEHFISGDYESSNESNREIKSITLDSGVEITVEQLRKIVYNIK